MTPARKLEILANALGIVSITLGAGTIALAYAAIWVSDDGNWQNTAFLTGVVALILFMLAIVCQIASDEVAK